MFGPLDEGSFFSAFSPFGKAREKSKHKDEQFVREVAADGPFTAQKDTVQQGEEEPDTKTFWSFEENQLRCYEDTEQVQGEVMLGTKTFRFSETQSALLEERHLKDGNMT